MTLHHGKQGIKKILEPKRTPKTLPRQKQLVTLIMRENKETPRDSRWYREKGEFLLENDANISISVKEIVSWEYLS